MQNTPLNIQIYNSYKNNKFVYKITTYYCAIRIDL